MLASVEQVRKLAEGILTANGVPADHARIQAGLFLEAEMRAIPSHGLLRLRRVIERIHAGLTVPGVSGKQQQATAWIGGQHQVDAQRIAIARGNRHATLRVNAQIGCARKHAKDYPTFCRESPLLLTS